MSRKEVKQGYKNYNRIPKKVELFGREIETFDDTIMLNMKGHMGQARYGANQIAISAIAGDRKVADDELKLTYLHEMLHFILNFTGFEKILLETGKVDLEQFIELMASAIYQYEKSAEY